MFNKKKPVEKPNKIKIQLALDRCKESIQTLLDTYGQTIEGYLAKMTNLKKEGRLTEAARYKEKLKIVLSRQTKMMDLMDQVEQFGFMIDEAFAKNDVYGTLGTVLGEANKISVSPEIKKILNDVNKFDDIFTKGLNKMDAVFGKISKTVVDVSESTSNNQDHEIEAIVNSRIEQYDQQTTREAEGTELGLFDLT
ncbi:MAG: hypothetical protein J6B34_05200 [Clostridia bacterium]|nr:hypothetical protein [Clostridia bacterium]